MNRVNTLYQDEQDDLIEQYMADHPGADEEEAGEAVYEQQRIRWEDVADAAHEAWKQRRMEENDGI